MTDDTQSIEVPAPPAPMPATPAAAPPAPAAGWVMPAPAARGGRTTLAAAAGVAMLVLGILGALIGIGIIVFGGVVGSLDLSQYADTSALGANASKFVGGVVVFVGIVILSYSTFYLVGAVGVLRSKDWGRVIGIVVGILSGLVWLTGVASRGGAGFALVMLAIHAYIVIALALRWREPGAAAAA